MTASSNKRKASDDLVKSPSDRTTTAKVSSPKSASVAASVTTAASPKTNSASAAATSTVASPKRTNGAAKSKLQSPTKQQQLSAPAPAADIDWDTRQRSVFWDKTEQCLQMIDQRDLPHSYGLVAHRTVKHIAESIKNMLVRGAPAIGAAGAFGMSIACSASKAKDAKSLLAELQSAKLQLDAARPTAVNLEWATARMLELAQLLHKHNVTHSHWSETMLHEACSLADDDVRINRALGAHGNTIVPHGAAISHHCNTGCLATVDFGTALGVIYSAHHAGKQISVLVDETRPRLQGAKLTAWELMREGVPMQLIVDGASGSLMHQKKIDLVVFGADRVARNGDVANKIGTYNLACCAKYNQVPVYACVPCSTIDLATLTGAEIEIEQRGSEEVTHVGVTHIAPPGCAVLNPAFDVTPAALLTGIITEEGICYAPFAESLTKAKEASEKRVRDAWNQRLALYLAK